MIEKKVTLQKMLIIVGTVKIFWSVCVRSDGSSFQLSFSWVVGGYTKFSISVC